MTKEESIADALYKRFHPPEPTPEERLAMARKEKEETGDDSHDIAIKHRLDWREAHALDPEAFYYL